MSMKKPDKKDFQMSFVITGNQEDPAGNPLGYTRTTQASKWNPKYQRYSKWKNFVVAACMKQMPKIGGFNSTIIDDEIDSGYVRIMSGAMQFKNYNLYPFIISKSTVIMDVRIKWANEKRPDPDNVFKGIADSLFKDDKHVYGSVLPMDDAENLSGLVSVKIKIKTKQSTKAAIGT